MTTLHVVIASLHVVLGHFGSSLIYRARFGRSPLVVYRAGPSTHTWWSRLAGVCAVVWGVAFVASVYSPPWSASVAGRALFDAPSALAWGLALGGLALMVWSQIAMGSAFRIGQDDRDAPSELRRSGPHARCRNPIYVGSWVAIVGMTLWHPSIVLVVTALATAVAMHNLVLAEERFLLARFGAAFTTYCKTTPRYGIRLR